MRARRGSARLFVVTVAVAVPMVVASGCGDSGKPADGPVSLIDSTNSSPGPVPVPGYSVPGVVPAHGMAYRTVSGTVVATLAGEVLFTIPGVHVIDRSRDSATMAAVVAFDTDTGNPPQGYELDIGAVMMRTIGPAMDVSPYAAGWVAEGAPNGCMRDARRQGRRFFCARLTGWGQPSSPVSWMATVRRSFRCRRCNRRESGSMRLPGLRVLWLRRGVANARASAPT